MTSSKGGADLNTLCTLTLLACFSTRLRGSETLHPEHLLPVAAALYENVLLILRRYERAQALNWECILTWGGGEKTEITQMMKR